MPLSPQMQGVRGAKGDGKEPGIQNHDPDHRPHRLPPAPLVEEVQHEQDRNDLGAGGLSVADFDADGKDEVVAATSGVYFLGAAGVEKSGGSGASAAALADLDGD